MGFEPSLLQLIEAISSCFRVLPRFLSLFLRVCKFTLDIIEPGVINSKLSSIKSKGITRKDSPFHGLHIRSHSINLDTLIRNFLVQAR